MEGDELTTRPLRAGVFALLAAAALVACSPSSAGSVPDDVLLDQISGLDGVTSASLEFQSDPTYGPHYEGEIVVDEDLLLGQGQPGACRHSLEILWQGRTTQTSSIVLVWGEERWGGFERYGDHLEAVGAAADRAPRVRDDQHDVPAIGVSRRTRAPCVPSRRHARRPLDLPVELVPG